MPAFQTSADIANRALQHCGARRLDPALGFNDGTVNASETSFAYDKLREAELRRAAWVFSIKKTTLRPIGNTTMLLSPALWVSTTTYYNGSIVSDATGNLWISLFNSNVGNDPTQTNFWEPYYGPMAVPQWDSSLQSGYNTGELVYATIGNGLYRVFLSIGGSANVDDPLIPTIWLSTTAYNQGQTIQFYPAWLIGTTYAQGQVASVTSSGTTTYYVSLVGSNIGNSPTTDNGTHWMSFNVTTTNQPQVSEWSVTTAYSTNNLVGYNGSVYLAIANSTGAVPSSSPSSWVALSGATAYQSLINGNTNQEPDLAPLAWSSLTTYSSGQQAYGSDGQIYTSSVNSNLNHNPVTDAGVHWTATGIPQPWTTSFVGGTGSMNWLEIGGTEFPNGVGLTTLNLIYPAGTGPNTQNWNKNVFRLPAGFLRDVDQNPKQTTPWGGGPSGVQYKDWTFADLYLISWSPSPITLRFAANVTDVRRMDPMFCELLGCQVALAVVERLTQSTTRVQMISQELRKWEHEAIAVNAIEKGWEDSPDDDFITCRY